MFKRLAFVSTVFLFSALNANGVASNDSFSLQGSSRIEIKEWSLIPYEDPKFVKSSIEITAEQDGSDFDDLIINTIASLVNEINPEVAASIYLGLIKKSLDIAFNPSNLEFLASSNNKEELNKNVGIFFQKLFESLSSQDDNLKTSVCFATFTKETVKEITNAMANCMQNYCIKMNELTAPKVDIQSTTDTQDEMDTQTATDAQATNDTQAATSTQTESDIQIDTDIQKTIKDINQLLSDFSKNILTSIISVFEKHEYKIDRQVLGL
jgi:hypothetical protein